MDIPLTTDGKMLLVLTVSQLKQESSQAICSFQSNVSVSIRSILISLHESRKQILFFIFKNIFNFLYLATKTLVIAANQLADLSMTN